MDQELLHELENLQDLPTLPGTAFRVMQMALEPDVSLPKMAEIIMSDVALSTRILKVVNSSYHSFSHTITNINQAVVILGLNMVKNVALSLTVMDSFKDYLDQDSYIFLLNRSLNTASPPPSPDR